MKMCQGARIDIQDNDVLRQAIADLVDQTSHNELTSWALQCAGHVLSFAQNKGVSIYAIENGFRVTGLWQRQEASIAEVRKAAINIHRAARLMLDPVIKSIFRTAGHAVATAHMREHALVCTDYAIQAIQTQFSGQADMITHERQWQLDRLIQFQPTD